MGPMTVAPWCLPSEVPWAEFARRWERLPTRPQRNEALRARFRHDVPSFLRWLWPDVFVRPFVAVHLDVLTRPKVRWQDRIGSQTRTLRALAAPRGFAKTGTAIASLCHSIVYGYERVVPVLSAELTLSRTSLATVRAMLSDPAVERLYGPVTFQGGTDRYTVTVGPYRCTLIAKSFGTSVRGLKEGAIRPTLLIVDDGEDRLLVNNPDQRRKWWNFLHEDVLKLGDIAGGLEVQFLGTVLHKDSVLSRLLDAPGWRSRRFAACEAWPVRMDLWAECGRVWADLALGDLDVRRSAARAFYEERQAEMDRGAVMLSSAWMDLFAFWEVIWSEGLGAALRELQSTPRDPSAALFDSAAFPRCRVLTLPNGELAVQRLEKGNPVGPAIRRADLRVTLRLDPIPGEQMDGLAGGAGASDYAAIAAIARDPHGRAYVVDGWMRRATDSAQMAAFWLLATKWQVERAKIEANGFQRWMHAGFRRLQAERREKGEWYQTALAETADSVSTTNKANDITALEPVIANAWIWFAEHLPGDGMAQFDEFPSGTHDDFPDVVARGYRDSAQGSSGSVNLDRR